MRWGAIILLLLLPLLGAAQADTVQWLPTLPAYYSFISYEENGILRANKLDRCFEKLSSIRHTHTGRMNIVHIGDSHLQADGMTSVLRNGLQDYFGNAGRGLIFPYQVAGTNAPKDVSSWAGSHWKASKLTNPNLTSPVGICGYGIFCAGKEANVHLRLYPQEEGRDERFNKMTFFLQPDNDIVYTLSDSTLSIPRTFSTHNRDTAVVIADTMMPGFSLNAMNASPHNDHCFYGVCLEKKDAPGVLYHTIGVNGARMDQYLVNDLFWKQLRGLDADLVIISLGTNEAQNPFINEEALINTCDSFVHMVRRAAPNASVLFTTPAPSYFRKKKPNASVESVSKAITQYCSNAGLPVWDLYHIAGGKNGAVAWKKYELLNPNDLVHYTMQGYQLQGQMLLNAFARGYNTHERQHPYKPPPPAPKPKPATIPVPAAPAVAKPVPPKLIAPAPVPPYANPINTKKAAVDTARDFHPPAPHKTNIKVEYYEE